MSFEINPENKEYFKDLRHKEVIVCAANLFKLLLPDGSTKTIVLPMVRHYSPDCHEHLYLWKDAGIKRKEIEQGFITNQCRFVSRKEALEIAKKHNQILHSIGYEPDELYSEMLY